jgi:hypothetical protein
MSYQISQAYCWYNKGTMIVKMYFVNHIPFTFDDLEDIVQDDPEIIKKANEQLTLTPEIFYLNSFYLIDEEAHPLLFEMDLENPEDLPEDIMEFDEEDLS